MKRSATPVLALIAACGWWLSAACMVGEIAGPSGGESSADGGSVPVVDDASPETPPDDGAPPTSYDARPPEPGAPDATPPGPPAPDAATPGEGPGSGVEWIDFGALNARTSGSWGTVLTDIAQHCPPAQVDYYMVAGDRVASGHELSHGIHAHIRNDLGDWGDNGFYVLGDKAALVTEPGIRKSDVVPYIPARFRGSRYDLYILGQVEWDDTPLYVWDEWNAYINGTEVGIDLAEAGAWTGGWQDVCAGPLEFTVYAVAIGMAVETLDPGYFAADDQFREFLAWNAARALDGVRRCLELDAFGSWPSIDEYYSDLRTHADGAALRAFLTDTYGAAYTAELLDL